MAINKKIEVTIQVNGTNTREYDDSDEDSCSNEVIKYIEVVSGAPFTFAIKVPKKYRMTSNCLSFELYADGN